MEGRITRGTTIKGRAVNEGEVVTLDPDTYRKLELTKDIEPVKIEITDHKSQVSEEPEQEPSDLTADRGPQTSDTESPKKAVATKKRK